MSGLSDRFIVPGGLFLLALMAASAGALCAHTIPVSYLTVVPDKEFVHLELVINPFDLTFFSEVDSNHDGRLDRDELPRFKEIGTRLLLQAIEIRVGGKVIQAEVAGTNLAPDSHHVIMRAQYRMDAREVPISIGCSLAKITRGGHLTSVRYINHGQRQSAVLDVGQGSVTFSPTGNSAKASAQTH